MLKYIGKRLFMSALTLFALLTLTFFMMHALPGDPYSGDKELPEAARIALEQQYGTNRPIHEQYIMYLGNAIRGDFGRSINYERPVTDIILESLPVSFELGMRALTFAVIMGVFLGVIAAMNRGKAIDTVAMLIAIIGVSIPSFIIGALIQYGFAVLPLGNPSLAPFAFPVIGWSTEMHKILPAFALSLGSLATVSRLMRTSMLDVLNSDYIKTAKAKGLSKSQVITRHAVRNAIMPVITVLGPISAALLTGTFVVENIFGIPGLGRSFVISTQSLDYTLIAGLTVFYGAVLIFANLIVDILYGIVDPRVKLDK